MQSINQKIELPFLSNCTIYIKREDLIHPIVSGNKFRKLKYNIVQAKAENKTNYSLLEEPIPIILLRLLMRQKKMVLDQ
jgi:hypothetical protein